VIVLDHLTEEQRRAYRLADNKLTEIGTWDEALLAGELQELLAEDVDLSMLGFSDAELDQLLAFDGSGEEADGTDGEDVPEAPVIVLDHLTDEQRKAYRIGDNKLTELGAWDEALLAGELQELLAEDVDLSMLGFSDAELDRLLAFDGSVEAAAGDEGEDIPEAPVDPVSRPGDLWLLGPHRLLCGDATVITDLDRLMAGRKADLPDADRLIADKGYDSGWFREALTDLEITPCIPGRANRKAPIPYDADL
jgi:ParB-like chromosome segregation protein Spo0J